MQTGEALVLGYTKPCDECGFEPPFFEGGGWRRSGFIRRVGGVLHEMVRGESKFGCNRDMVQVK